MPLTFQGKVFHTEGVFPEVGTKAPDFNLLRSNLSEATLKTYAGKRKVLNVFPSIDTNTCAKSVHRFNKEASYFPDVQILNISVDLPFAHKRFCVNEGIDRSESLSGFRSTFGFDYGVTIVDGPLQSLYSRAVLILDKNDDILYLEQVQEIANEPNYEAALMVLRTSCPSVFTKG